MKGVCFVLPAAGRGSRLGQPVPKILAQLTPRLTVWNILYERLRGVAEHVHVVVSPEGKPLFEKAAAKQLASGAVSTSVQEVPRGMGDAIFGAADHWRRFQNAFVLWGDQVGITRGTLTDVVEAHLAAGSPGVTLPVVWADHPYVQYRFDAAGRLERVLQSREGDACDPAGYSDVGFFALSTEGLPAAWTAYEKTAAVGEKTGEANFLPFLSHLSKGLGWPVRQLVVPDAAEARGLNTPEDLDFFRDRLEGTA